jgi:hypothetical protein
MRMGTTLDAIGDRVSPGRVVERRRAAMAARARSVKESVMGSPAYEEPRSAQLRERARGTAQEVGEKAQEAAHAVQHAPEQIATQTRGNPLAAGLVAFGAGMVLATAMPRSKTEQRLASEAQPQMQRIREDLRQAGREIASDAKEHAREAADDLRSSGAEAAQRVQEEAKSSAEHLRDETRR